MVFANGADADEELTRFLMFLHDEPKGVLFLIKGTSQLKIAIIVPFQPALPTGRIVKIF